MRNNTVVTILIHASCDKRLIFIVKINTTEISLNAVYDVL